MIRLDDAFWPERADTPGVEGVVEDNSAQLHSSWMQCEVNSFLRYHIPGVMYTCCERSDRDCHVDIRVERRYANCMYVCDLKLNTMLNAMPDPPCQYAQ